MNSINLREQISCKYILKKIFSLIKVTKALNIIKLNKEIKEKLDISLFHYQYYYFFILFKAEKIETIDDIINSPYLKIFPENVKYELIIKYIEAKKLFKNEYIYLNIKDNNNISLIKKFKEKKFFNYIIGNIEEQKYSEENITNYHNNILKIILKDINNIDKVLFDYNFFFDKDNNNISKMNIDHKNIKYLYINLISFYGKEYNISLFNNLEYLSLALDSNNENIVNKEIKIKISEEHYKNMKSLKIIESKKAYYIIKNIIFETEKNIENKSFENIKELHIKEKLLNKIKFNPNKLQKLNIIYDYRDNIYTIDYIQNSLLDIIQKYSLLNSFNIYFYYKKNQSNSFYDLIIEISNFLFNVISDIENFSIHFWEIHEDNYWKKYWESDNCCFKKLPNKKSKYIIKGHYIPFNLIASHLDKIEEMDLSGNYKTIHLLPNKKKNLISSLTKIRIKYNRNKNCDLYLPIKSFSSLNFLDLDIDYINSYYNFPLFSIDSTIQFCNLEYLSLKTETIGIINGLINNFNNIPNLRFLSIISKYICDTIFPYQKDIINKCKLLKKLHTLIIIDNVKYSTLKDENEYYSIFPELKNTHIRFCALSNNK